MRLPAAQRAGGGRDDRGAPVSALPVPAGAIVSGFLPMKSEINPLPLLRKLADAGAQLALPAIAGRGKPLIMRAWAFGEPLNAGQWGIREPTPEAAEVAPDILIVPLACFDRAGHRIGYGAGYYDMTIARSAREEAGHRHRHRLCRAGNSAGARHGARRAPRSRANGARGDRFSRALSVMRILFIGDIVGRSGRTIVLERLPGLIADWKLDLVVINGENAAGGFGITEAIYNELHRRRRRRHHARQPRLGPARGAGLHRARAAPDPPGQLSRRARPGRGAALVDTKNGKRALVINAMGRIFMDPLDDPFAAVERELAACALGNGADAIIIDMHCEATSEKQAMGFFCDGRASLVVGTHTHAPTADHRILPGGTAFISDVGMTGDYDSVIGMAKDEPLNRFLRKIAGRQIRAGERARRRCAASRSRPTTRPALRGASARCASAACSNEARPAFWR